MITTKCDLNHSLKSVDNMRAFSKYVEPTQPEDMCKHPFDRFQVSLRHHFFIFAFVMQAWAPLQAATFLWEASSGFTPDAVSQGMLLVDDAAQNPVLASGKLTLTTTNSADSMYFIHTGSVMGIFELPQIETTMRFVSGGFSGGRAPTMISFGVGSGVGANILFKQDLVQTSNAAGSSILQSASVDTDGSFHTYRIALSGTTAGSSFTVYQDNVAILTDTLLSSVSAFGSTPNVAFGDLTSIAFGTSEWLSFSHNMLVPEPSRAVLIELAMLGILIRRRRNGQHALD